MTISLQDTTTAKLSYFEPPLDGSRPYNNINAGSNGYNDSNWVRAVKEDIPVENLRGREDSVTLDTAGFQFYRSPAKHTSFRNDDEIEREYYPESIELIKKLTGASRVVLFDHTIRRRRPGEIDDGPTKRQPVALVHVDQTPESAANRVRRHLPADDVPTLLSKRFQIINLWRPIGHAALDWPLALCDFRSVDVKNDLVPVALIYPDREGETFGVKYNAGHRWKYLRGMEPDEVALIKCFDTVQEDGTAWLTPHTGFEDPSTPEGAPLRESIELRALVFYD
ncbi:hypothetical protein PLICRDRAFT_56712 [Plicaturopsis crispa FD-325 SS-3]|nr:hypothetical protein PLICRDRAFT_56712 [Plicaturopsis crispa FD-325 SS-3]